MPGAASRLIRMGAALVSGALPHDTGGFRGTPPGDMCSASTQPPAGLSSPAETLCQLLDGQHEPRTGLLRAADTQFDHLSP